MKVSIIVPYYNSPLTIKACVDSIEKQMEVGDELIIVNDASSEQASYPLKSLNRFKVIIHDENLGAASARNSGMEQAQNDVFVFIDADVLIQDGCIAKIKNTISDEKDACFVVPGNESAGSFFSDYKNLYMMAILLQKADQVNYIYGSCCAVGKRFSSTLWPTELNLIEDNIWGHKLWSRGAQIGKIEDNGFIHLKRYDFIKLIKNDFFVARQFARFMVRENRWKTLYGKQQFGHTSKKQKVSVIIALLVPFVAFSSLELSVALLALWSVLSMKLFSFFWRKRGLGFLIPALFWTYISHLVYFTGIVSGFFNELIVALKGRRYSIESD